jgi:hypothetical protein
MTVTSLNNYSFAWNNFVFGGAGSPYQIQSVDGLEALPDIRTQDDNRGYNDGMFSGRDFLAGRKITLHLLVLAGNGNSAQTNFNLLQQALQPQQTGTTPLQFQLSPSGGLQRINARVRTSKAAVDPEYTYGFIKAQYDFFCPDPKYYDDTQQSASLSVSNPLGRTYNRVYNLVFGGGSTGTTTSVINNGWATTYPVITMNGPIRNPLFGNTTSGTYLQLTGSYSSSDILVVDLDQKLVTLNGTPARQLISSGNWFAAPPGTSQFYMSGSGTTAGVTSATITWRSAYI